MRFNLWYRQCVYYNAVFVFGFSSFGFQLGLLSYTPFIKKHNFCIIVFYFVTVQIFCFKLLKFWHLTTRNIGGLVWYLDKHWLLLHKISTLFKTITINFGSQITPKLHCKLALHCIGLFSKYLNNVKPEIVVHICAKYNSYFVMFACMTYFGKHACSKSQTSN